MSSVFQGAFLIIAATDAKDGDGGLFLSSLSPPMEAKCKTDGTTALLRCPAADTNQLHSSILNSRAWVLQEVVLSCRTVHFKAEQMFWQCRTFLLSEDGLLQDQRFSSLRESHTVHKPLDFKNHSITLQYWWKWINDYSARTLTNHEDWIAATAGITRYFEEATGLTPCLGIWKESLVHDLSWGFIPPYTPKRSIVANVPTWSWYRFESLFTTPRFRNNPILMEYAMVQKAEICWTGRPLTSQIAASYLLLLGPIKHLTFRISYVGDQHVLKLENGGLAYLSYCRFDERSSEELLGPVGESFTTPCMPLATYDQ
jgi:hypothetical protein